MDFEDRLSIATPEGVSVDVTLAGPGSRIGAAFIDALIQFGTILIVLLIIAGVAGDGDGIPDGSDRSEGELLLIGLAVINVFMFIVLFFYSVLFETLWSGRTPGKRAFGLRVVRVTGAPIGFTTSMVRNLVRIVDLLPGMYAIGLCAVVASRRNQRLGDMVAGTIVVRDLQKRKQTTWSAPTPTYASTRSDQQIPSGAETWDVSAITADELATIRAFLDRRHSIPADVRQRLASELESKLRPRVPGAPEWPGYPEVFLERLAAVKAARS